MLIELECGEIKRGLDAWIIGTISGHVDIQPILGPLYKIPSNALEIMQKEKYERVNIVNTSDRTAVSAACALHKNTPLRSKEGEAAAKVQICASNDS